ncbi:MAG: 50S ribosomal protein L20 [Patescibacteria group bacterium]
MTRIKRGLAAHKRRKHLLKETKGFTFGRSKKYRAAKQAYLKAGTYAYRDRRARKREFRRLWIIRLNAACREFGLPYNQFIAGLKKAKIELNRKILADLAILHPETFAKIVEMTKKS